VAPNPLSHGLSFTRRIDILANNLARPFALVNHSQPPITLREARTAPVRTRSDVTDATEMTLSIHQSSFNRDRPMPTHLSSFLQSERSDVLHLPFRLTLSQAHDKLQRNMPYLRQSWGRIDLIAIIGFWVSFALATAGVERGTYHIGIFRALSVLRTARLLAITSGTTVCAFLSNFQLRC
jgi:voltage-dependent calcium channel